MTQSGQGRFWLPGLLFSPRFGPFQYFPLSRYNALPKSGNNATSLHLSVARLFAKALGLAVTRELLARADEPIE